MKEIREAKAAINTNNIILAYIAGKSVVLNNKQTELYLKYKSKYGIK